MSASEYANYLHHIIENWSEMWKALDPYLMASGEIRMALEKSGAITMLSVIHRTYYDAIQALLYGSHYRARFTILDLLWELGLFPEMADPILLRAGV